MDLHTAERHDGNRWNGAKIGAFFCFAVAGAILIASLLYPAPPQAGHQNGLAANLSTTPR